MNDLGESSSFSDVRHLSNDFLSRHGIIFRFFHILSHCKFYISVLTQFTTEKLLTQNADDIFPSTYLFGDSFIPILECLLLGFVNLGGRIV